MRSLLMFADRDFRPEREPQVGEQDLVEDLELDTLWDAMACGDEVIRESACSAILAGLDTPEQICYRQAVLTDCLRNPAAVREIYALAVEAVARERKVYRGGFYSSHGEPLLRRSVSVLEIFVEILKRLRRITGSHGESFHSEGFTAFFATLRRELDDDYFDEVHQHLRHLRFRDGVLASARLGRHSQGVDYVLRSPGRPTRAAFVFRRPAIPKPTHSYTIPPRDEAGGQALAALRSRILSLVANATAQSTDHILAFFTALRTELAFYIGCLNLHDQLAAKREPTCLPDPHPAGTVRLTARGLYDPCLSLRIGERVQGNDLNADGKNLIVITGANQGGKSTFLRSLGIAQLMMRAGAFVAAESFAATIARGVFTHYKREEDATMTSGKFDEELHRMSTLAQAIDTGCLVLCNESFAATNEREGSDVAAEIIRALNDTGNTVVFVTHLSEFARTQYERHDEATLFLRADRRPDGHRTFRIREGEPLSTSYGDDIYQRTFGTQLDDDPAARPAAAIRGDPV